MKKPEGEDERNYKKLLKALIITQTYLETLDEVKYTSTLYKGNIMKRVGALIPHLEKSLGSKFTKIFTRDEDSFGVVIESTHIVAKWISENSIEDLFALADAMKNNELKFIKDEKK